MVAGRLPDRQFLKPELASFRHLDASSFRRFDVGAHLYDRTLILVNS
jgi:hypothetical protein